MTRLFPSLKLAIVTLAVGTTMADSTVWAQKATAKKKGTALQGTPKEASDGDSGLKFSRDVAPILVGNCLGCHNPERRRGKLDLTTFEKVMAGSDVEKIIEPGKPDESHLVLRLRGEETPKMPQGNNNNLSDEAIERIEKWVRAGARLDAGIDPKALLTSYAPTAEQLRAAQLRKMPVAERDLIVITAAYQRWNQASPKNKPEVTSSEHFLLFSTLPKNRAVGVIKGIESAYAQLRSILSRPNQPALDWPEKLSLFAFSDAASFVEFVRTQENREIGAADTGTAALAIKEPYVAVVDPLSGRDEPGSSASSRKTSRTRRGTDDSATVERSVAGLLAEQLALGVLRNEKNAPAWLCQGLAASLAAGLDPRSTYVQRLRGLAAAQLQQGWTARANDALEGQLRLDETRAVGYAFIDWMMHNPQTRRAFPTFVQELSVEGGAKLNDVLEAIFSARRQDFLYASGEWVARFGPSR
jgi:mono/diheme cytochrome c family protein